MKRERYAYTLYLLGICIPKVPKVEERYFQKERLCIAIEVSIYINIATGTCNG